MKRWSKWVPAGLALSLAATMTGCSSDKLAGGEGGKPSVTLKELGKDEKASIKVLFFDKNYFSQMYGSLFSAKFPNIDVQVVSMQSIFDPGKDTKKEYQKLVDEEKPDVLLFPTPELFEQWAADGKLLQLDDVIRQDKFDVENMMPTVLEQIKSMGDGKLYGLAPSFFSQALFYNRDLFEKHGVPLPKNQMTWEEVLELAKRFPTNGQGEQRIYGMASYYQFNGGKPVGYKYMNEIGSALGLSILDREKGTVTLQSDGWKKALTLAADAMKSGAIYNAKDSKPIEPGNGMTMEDILKQDLFVTGKAAMTIGGSYYIETLLQAKDSLKDVKPVNWDIVTVPVDPRNPEASDAVSVSKFFAVHVDSPNQRAAWELVKYINSEEVAKATVSSNPGELSTRTAYIKERDGRSLEPLTMLKMVRNGYPKGAEPVPVSFYSAFDQMAEAEVQAVVESKKSVDEALKTMQEKGQDIYNKAKREQKDTEKKGQG
ncbi:extracellular solute-binding protein [Paenibacillus ehimensis]|uniref:ABC transporter substrate-binding protein n=1 Tax=Paenibacillus ehimensis TaxID=79264 RepID=UPI002DBBD4E4|nr:extracellular solute-binding protein [Paenibacillus ehimensis]MEC0210493.1 extracellular solute-binding protein [Paenibacillus ehimensis]